MEAILFIGATALYIYAFWALYVFSMGIYRAQLAGRLKGLNRVLAAPIVLVAVVVDVLANLFIAPFIFGEKPSEWLVTTRLRKIMAQGEAAGTNYKIAKWLCDSVLDPFDPKGDHC